MPGIGIASMPLVMPLLVWLLSLAAQPQGATGALLQRDDAPPPSPSSTVTTSIHGRLRLPDPSAALNATRVTLNDGATHGTYTQPDGSFVFHRVPPGVHLLDVQSREHHFSQVKVRLLADAMDVPTCIEYVYPGAPKQAIPHPLDLTAHASYEYYEPRPGFSPFSMLKNPMVMMMLLSVGGMLLVPRMMESMDPEEREQMQRTMANQGNPSKVRSVPSSLNTLIIAFLLTVIH